MQKLIKSFALVATLCIVSNSIQGMFSGDFFKPKPPSATTIKQDIEFMKAMMAGNTTKMKELVGPLQAASGIVEDADLTEKRLKETAKDPAKMLAKMLLSNKERSPLDINTPNNPNNPEGSRLLDFAAEAGNADCVKVLLKHGADPSLVATKNKNFIQGVISH